MRIARSITHWNNLSDSTRGLLYEQLDGSSKGDWDVGITIDALLCAEHVDEVVLLSGDGDFDLLLKTLRQQYDVSSHFFSVAELRANSLINSADRWTEIDEKLLQ